MKRIEAIVQSDIPLQVVKEIRRVGAEAVTFMESLGQGQRPEIQGKIAEFNSTQVIISVVRDSQSDKVISSIMEVAHTGQNKDGKKFVTDVLDTYNISKKQKVDQ